MRALRFESRRDPAPTYLIGFVAAGAAFTLAGPALVLLKRQVGVDTGAIGVVFSAVGLGYLVSSVVAAKGYDRGWGNRLLATALLVLSGALLCIPKATTLATLAAAFLFVGAAIAAIDVGANTLLVWRKSTASGPWLAALHFCFGLGALLIPLGVRLSQTRRGDVALACWLIAVLASSAAIAVATARTPEHPHMRNTELRPGTRLPHAQRRLVIAIVVFFYLYVGVEGGFGAWIYTYATEIGLGATAATGLTTTFWACFTAGRLLAVLLARFFGSFRLVVSSSFVAALAMLALVVANGSPTVVWPATALFGFAVAPQFPLMISFAGTQLNLAASTTGRFVATAGVANLTLPWCIGQLIDRTGPAAMPMAILALVLGSLVALRWVARVADLRHRLRLSRGRRPEAIASR
jgi:FHS family Na+ dependent glucose MFS transporter 1